MGTGASVGRTFLITGGSGSGKSAVAQRLASRLGDPVVYLATGQASGAEMAARIRKHRASRPQHWPTVEAPRDLAAALVRAPEAPVVLLEDLPSLVRTCLPQITVTGGQLQAPAAAERLAQETLDREVDAVFRLCADRGQALVVVTSEVGSGVLPSAAEERLFKDVLGRLNARLARQVDQALLVVAGLAVDLTALDQATCRDPGLADTPRHRAAVRLHRQSRPGIGEHATAGWAPDGSTA